MLNEIEEFKAYTQFPKYRANGKRDMSFLGRFTFDMLIKQIGLNRVLTIIARLRAVICMQTKRLILTEHDVHCRRGAACRQKRRTIGKRTPISVSFMISSPNWLIKTAAVGFIVMFTTSMIISETIPIPSVKRPSKNVIR